MTSLAQLPPRGKQMARALGNRVKLLSRKSAPSPALNRCAWRNLRPIQEESSRTRAHFHARAVTSARRGSGGDPFQNDQLRRTVLPTSCGCQVDNTTYCILRLFSPNQKSYPFWSAQIFNLQGLDEASEYQCHLFREPCADTLFAIRSSALRRAPANEVHAPQLKARKLAHPLDSSPAMQTIQRPFSVQLCGRLWIVRKSGPPNGRHLSGTIFRPAPSNQRTVTLVTDGWVAGSNNEIGMISRSAMRRSLSLVLSLVIVLWAETGLAMPSASGHGSKCRVRMVQMHRHATHSATLASSSSCCRQGPHTMPCCPPHPAPAAAQCGERLGCCDISSQPARPLAFLVASGNSVSLQLSANSPAGTIFVAAPSSSAILLIGHAPQRPVLELKTDLRI